MRGIIVAMVGLVAGAVLAAADTSAETRFNFTADPNGGKGWGPSYRGKKEVDFTENYRRGTIVIKTSKRKLYLVLGDGKAIEYGVGVGRKGYTWSGRSYVSRKAEWPGWTPPAAMRARQPELPPHMPGGPNNPLGARALYIGSSLYRIHGTSQPHTIGTAVSSGCIRLINSEVIDLYNRVPVGAPVIVTY